MRLKTSIWFVMWGVLALSCANLVWRHVTTFFLRSTLTRCNFMSRLLVTLWVIFVLRWALTRCDCVGFLSYTMRWLIATSWVVFVLRWALTHCDFLSRLCPMLTADSLRRRALARCDFVSRFMRPHGPSSECSLAGVNSYRTYSLQVVAFVLPCGRHHFLPPSWGFWDELLIERIVFCF